MQLLLGGTQKSSPALGAAHAPDTDVNQRLTMDQTVVQGIHQAHGIFLQDHQHILALTPGTIVGLAPVASLGQLLDTVIDSNAALPWCQVLLGHLYPAQRADRKALSSWLQTLDIGIFTIPC